MFQHRVYRHLVHSPGLVSFAVIEKESDLFISTVTNLSKVALGLVRRYRHQLETYIAQVPHFAASLAPVKVEPEAPEIIRAMAMAAEQTGVGPMAAVAGAMAQFVGEELGKLSPEVILENGGDIYLKGSQKRVIAIYAGNSPLSGRLGLEIMPETLPLGVCTSSATVGPSLSLGKTDATVAVASSAVLADAAATAIGNTVGSAEDISKGLKLAQGIAGLSGTVIIVGDKMGVWGNLKICPL